MTALLRLERFGALAAEAAAPAPPRLTAADLAAAEARGFAAGRADAEQAAEAQLAAAMDALAAALAQDAARAAGIDRGWRAAIVELVEAVATQLLPRLAAAALAERIEACVSTLPPAEAPRPLRIRCDAATAALLHGRIAGWDGVAATIEVAPGAAGVAVELGEVRLDLGALSQAVRAQVRELEGTDGQD